jgi:hypothetical protein
MARQGVQEAEVVLRTLDSDQEEQVILRLFLLLKVITAGMPFLRLPPFEQVAVVGQERLEQVLLPLGVVGQVEQEQPLQFPGSRSLMLVAVVEHPFLVVALVALVVEVLEVEPQEQQE